jgi:ATPase family protein associated with various cellular activities (AAA)/winged helix domain-containing protein
MSDLATWQKANDEYLAAAMTWLRLRLSRLSEGHPAPLASEPSSSMAPRPRSWFDRSRQEPDAGIPLIARPAVTSPEIDQAAELMERAAGSDPPPALVIVARRLGLVKFEQEILLLCAAMEIDTRTAALCAAAQGDPSRPYPTFALALALFDHPVWEALSPARPLRRWRLLDINQPGALPLTASALRADERVVSYIKGLNYLDDRLSSLLSPLPDAGGLPPSHRELSARIVRQLQASGDGLPVVHLLGPDSGSKRAIGRQTAHDLRLDVYRLGADMLPSGWTELEALARLWQRESQMLPVALYLDAQDVDKELLLVSRFLSWVSGLVFLETRDAWPQLGRDALTIDVAKPSAAEQELAWQSVLGPSAGKAPARIAGQFSLNLPDIHRIGRRVVSEGGDPAAGVWEACLLASRPRLDTLAQRLEVRGHGWDDLVLPEAEKSLLRQIINQVADRHQVYERWGFGRRLTRGLGISALFAGESGTGKTLAAEVIAQELTLNLYRIDLSQVVSKYIGETEKNLRKLFDAAEDGGAILFFDEADALFGKRSEVKDSHDRYANIEINYLLQRMEAYRGLAILATNMKNALDTAFTRRLRFIVNFPFPSVPERQQIWARAFPADTDIAKLDAERLARFNLTGGSIQNVAINAAFLAAHAGTAVTMPIVLDAIRNELRKLDRPVHESEFRLNTPAEASA